MASTSITPGDFSDYSSRHVTIEVTGGCHRELMRKAKYTKTIPYSSLSQTIQNINRLGGKITRVTLSPSYTQISKTEFVQPLSNIVESNVLHSANEVESSYPSPQPQEQNNSSQTYQVIQPTKTKQEQQANAVFNSGEYTFTEEW